MGRPLLEQSTVWLRRLIEAMDKVASSTAKPSASDRRALANRLKLPAVLPAPGNAHAPGKPSSGGLLKEQTISMISPTQLAVRKSQAQRPP